MGGATNRGEFLQKWAMGGALTGGQRRAQSPQQQEGTQHGRGSCWVLLPGLKYPPWEFLPPPPTPGEGGMGMGRGGGGELRLGGEGEEGEEGEGSCRDGRGGKRRGDIGTLRGRGRE